VTWLGEIILSLVIFVLCFQIVPAAVVGLVAIVCGRSSRRG